MKIDCCDLVKKQSENLLMYVHHHFGLADKTISWSKQKIANLHGFENWFLLLNALNNKKTLIHELNILFYSKDKVSKVKPSTYLSSFESLSNKIIYILKQDFDCDKHSANDLLSFIMGFSSIIEMYLELEFHFHKNRVNLFFQEKPHLHIKTNAHNENNELIIDLFSLHREISDVIFFGPREMIQNGFSPERINAIQKKIEPFDNWSLERIYELFEYYIDKEFPNLICKSKVIKLLKVALEIFIFTNIEYNLKNFIKCIDLRFIFSLKNTIISQNFISFSNEYLSILSSTKTSSPIFAPCKRMFLLHNNIAMYLSHICLLMSDFFESIKKQQQYFISLYDCSNLQNEERNIYSHIINSAQNAKSKTMIALSINNKPIDPVFIEKLYKIANSKNLLLCWISPHDTISSPSPCNTLSVTKEQNFYNCALTLLDGEHVLWQVNSEC